MDSGKRLLAAWRGGDGEAGEELFERHFESLCRFFRNKAPHVVDDLVQRTFLALLESSAAFRGEASVRTYLFAIARNELYAHLRRHNRAGHRFDPLHTSVAVCAPSPSSVAGHRLAQARVLAALRELPVDYQVALELYYWEDMTAGEIAVVLGCPEPRVRTRLRRARARLRVLLDGDRADPSLEVPAHLDGDG